MYAGLELVLPVPSDEIYNPVCSRLLTATTLRN